MNMRNLSIRSLIPFSNVSQFLGLQIFISLVRFILKHLILLHALVNEIAFFFKKNYQGISELQCCFRCTAGILFGLFIAGVQKYNRSLCVDLLPRKLAEFVYQLQQVFCRFFKIFYVQDRVICQQRYFYLFHSNLDAFYFSRQIPLARI